MARGCVTNVSVFMMRGRTLTVCIVHTVLNWTALHCAVQHSTALLCTVLNCAAPGLTELNCSAPCMEARPGEELIQGQVWTANWYWLQDQGLDKAQGGVWIRGCSSIT